MIQRECTNCGMKMPRFEPRKNGLCKACQVDPRRNYVSAGKENLGATAVTDNLGDYEHEMKGSEGAAWGAHIWEGMAKAMGYHDAEHMQMAKQNHMSGLLHERYGESAGGTHGVDDDGDPYYEVSHPKGWTARTYGGTDLHVGHKATPGDMHDAIDVSDGNYREGAKIHPAMTNGSPEGNHHMVKQHLDTWANEYGDDYAANIPAVKRYQQTHGIGKASSMRVQAHDSGDGETIYHCPFCGSGQVIARSDRTIECEFCHTCFTVQIQPQYPAFPQTINGQPVQVPGMPGQIGGEGPPDGMPPGGGPGMAGPDDAGAPFGDPGDAGPQDEGDVPPEGADGAPLDNEEDDPDEDGGGGKSKPPWLKGGAKISLRTTAGVDLDPSDYMRHLALRHAKPEERAAVLAKVREETSRGR